MKYVDEVYLDIRVVLNIPYGARRTDVAEGYGLVVKNGEGRFWRHRGSSFGGYCCDQPKSVVLDYFSDLVVNHGSFFIRSLTFFEGPTWHGQGWHS